MSRIRTTLRLVMVFTILISALASSQASAQRPGTSSTSDDEGVYESELTGLELTWSEDWELASTDVSDEEEIVELESENGVLYTGFGLYTDAEEARDDVVDGFASDLDEVNVIAEDVSRGFAWTLLEGVSGAEDTLYVYVEVEEDIVDDWEFLTVVTSTEDLFIDQYELVSETVEMDGGALLDEFDVDELEELIGGGTVATGDAATPESDDENHSETGRADEDDSASGAGDSYVFETGDIEVVVGDDIEIDETQLEDESYEQVLLVGVGSIGAVSLVQSPLGAEDTLDAFMSGFMQEMDDSRQLDTGVDGGVAWGLYEASVSGMDMYVYATVSDDQYEGHYLELIAAPADFFEDEFLAFQESVEINGVGMFDGIDIDDLLDIIDAA